MASVAGRAPIRAPAHAALRGAGAPGRPRQTGGGRRPASPRAARGLAPGLWCAWSWWRPLPYLPTRRLAAADLVRGSARCHFAGAAHAGGPRFAARHAPAQRARMDLVWALVQSRHPTAVDAAAWRHGQRCPASASCALAGKQRHTLDVCPALATAPQPPADPHGMGPAPALHRGGCRLERCRHRPGPGSAGLAGAGSRGGRATRRRRIGRTGRFGQRAAQPRRCAAITLDDARCDADAPMGRQQLA